MQFSEPPKPSTEIDQVYPPLRGNSSWIEEPVTFADRWSEFWSRPVVQKALRIGAIAGGVTLAIGAATWLVLFTGMPNLPRADELWTLNRAPAVQFVDAAGKTVAVRGNLYGPVVRGRDLPVYVGQAFIAAEDQRFMQHDGIDLQSISRAAFANLSAGRTVQGGSTLTQQLVKNLLVGDDQTIRRKAQEARLAMEMESALTKEEILDLYLNRVYLGANAYGVEAAAQTYFGKPAAELSLTESAFLAALPKAPSRYADDRTGAATTARVHYVLDRMADSGFVTREAIAAAKLQKLVFSNTSVLKPISGHVLDMAMKEAQAAVPALPPDAVIVTTIDGDLQRKAEAALKAALSVRRLGANEGAVVVMDRQGSIRALVGGKDYKTSQFNRATQALRQPGSAFKTFVYAAALEHGLEPTSIRNDAPYKLAGWEPGNYADEYRGQITLARALAVSSNSVAAQLGSELGAKEIVKLAKRFGIESPLHPYPSIALGADEVTLLEMTRAYGVLANDGRLTRPYLVSEIRDQRGAVLYRAPSSEGNQVYKPDTAAVLTGMLANVVRSGTGVQAQVPGWQIAGKTGTSQSWRDAWFVGYSSRMVGGVWIGNDDNSATRKVTGGSAAAALFSKVMTTAHRDLKPAPLRGADRGAEWLGADTEDMLDEWFYFPEPDPATESSELAAFPRESADILGDVSTAPLQSSIEGAVEPSPASLPSGEPAPSTIAEANGNDQRDSIATSPPNGAVTGPASAETPPKPTTIEATPS